MPNEARIVASPSPNETQPLRAVSPQVEARGSSREQDKKIPLAADRLLEIEPGGGAMRVLARDGQIELSIRITAEGPVLCFAAAAIEVAQTKAFKIDVERFELKARDVKLESSGNMQQIVAGDSESHCAGRYELQAGAVSLVSHDDTMVLDSTHDLAILGERVLINC